MIGVKIRNIVILKLFLTKNFAKNSIITNKEISKKLLNVDTALTPQ